MITIISPAKALDFNTKSVSDITSQPIFQTEAQELVEELKKLSPTKLGELMHVSTKLAELNFQRYQTWQLPFTSENAKQAVLAFNGEVFNGLDATSLNDDHFTFAQKSLRILSGLYGALRPMDLIQPYRLEMGTKFSIDLHKNLYEFWGDKITEQINQAIDESDSPYLINLASNEYFKSIKAKQIKAPIITPIFKQEKDGAYKTIAIFAKKARGLMTRFIIENGITNPEDLKAFDLDNYYFNNELSKGNNWVFTREYA
ncbi:peroxide stress protein YaaA [Puteibacter caeruleilacunae]|nr:peroxide stress protein YaaA [Puteibacter caeruleilacunae]